ncbi:MAG TPA: DNA gyrase modulator, partial [Candidatus Dormibacteraeota bacterium]|nr:DNA gyrase modulator [Candidatus Dormibacteraeota bacterium]
MLDQAFISRLLGRALRHGGEFADVFCERRHSLSYRLQDGRIHDASYGVTLGVGIRVVVGESAGYACSDDLSEQAMLDAADAASLIARSGPAGEEHAVDLCVERFASAYDGELGGAV